MRAAGLVTAVCLAAGPAVPALAQAPVGGSGPSSSSPSDALVGSALATRSVDGEAFRAWPRRPLLDAAREAIGAELVWRAPRGTRGAGATVCVVDTGLDVTLRDFQDARGRTRVRWLLDLDGAPRGAHAALEAGVGAVWSGDDIDAALALGVPVAPDWNGHGTTVAAAAAGDDAGELAVDPGARAGIAPEASLVVVRALRRGTPGLRDEDLVRGARFCVDRRVSSPERTVILLALGGHDGPHDGTSPLERALAALTTDGVAIVVAAGNDGDRAVHAGGRLVADEPVRLSLRLPSPELEDALVAVVVRGARESRVALPGGDATRWVRTGEVVDDGSLRVDATDGSATYVIWRGALRAGELAIEARGAIAAGQGVDAWLVDDRLGAALFAPRFEGTTALLGEEVTVPATAEGVIAVGGSVSRGFLPGDGGPGLTLESDEAGRASFSARGPRVDGAPLPTVLAPGGWVVAARSSAFDPDDPEGMLGGSRARFDAQRRGEDRIAVAGSSIAAAIVAGAVALARAPEPATDAFIDERAALSASAASLGLTAAFDPRVGSGLLDVPRYLALRGSDSAAFSELQVSCTRSRVTPASRDVSLVARSRDGGAAPLRALLARGAGRTVLATGELRGGHAVLPLALPSARIGESLVVELEARGVVRGVCALEVVPTEGPSEAPRIAGGACAIGARPPGAGLLVLALALVLARAPRRRARAPLVGIATKAPVGSTLVDRAHPDSRRARRDGPRGEVPPGSDHRHGRDGHRVRGPARVDRARRRGEDPELRARP